MNLITDPKYLGQNWQSADSASIFNEIIMPEVAVEKAGYRERQARIAKEMHEQGPVAQEALGQKIGSVDQATYIRWIQETGYNCWGDPAFVRKFLASNPECAAPTTTRRR